MNTLGTVLTFVGRVWEVAFLLFLLGVAVCIVGGALYDRRQRKAGRADVARVLELCRHLDDDPDPQWVERLRADLVAGARRVGYVRGSER